MFPEVGKTFSYDLSQVSVGRPVIGAMGFTNSTWGPIKLPLDLTKPAPGCWLFTSLEVLTGTAVTGSGTASIKMAIPNNKNFIGIQFYNQYIVIQPGVNSLGLQFSNGGMAKIGG